MIETTCGIRLLTERVEAAHLQALSSAERRTLARLLRRVLESQDHVRAGQRD